MRPYFVMLMQVSTTHSATQIDRPQALQRLKVGLIGLAAVLLLIGLASAVFNSVNRERVAAGIGGAQPARVAEMANTAGTVEGTNEPLAELGVAPPATVSPPNSTQDSRR